VPLSVSQLATQPGGGTGPGGPTLH
jgi:hypothetical protein